MLVSFGVSLGIILAHFMPKGRIMTARYYSKVILKLKKKKKKKKKKKMRPRLVLLYDNAPFHPVSSTVELNSFKWQLLSHPPYNLDLAPPPPPTHTHTHTRTHLLQLLLFPELKKGSLEPTMWEGRLWFQLYLSSRSTSWFAKEIQKLPRRRQKCIDVGAE